MQHVSEEAWTWTRRVLGDCEIVSEYAHSHGYSKLWRLRDSHGGHFWLKMHTFPNKWAGEVHALTHWTPALGLAPKLVASRSQPDAVILAECPGADSERLVLSQAEEERLWAEAGRWLGKMHERTNGWLGGVRADGSPDGKPSEDAESFVRASFEQRLREGSEMRLLDSAEIAFIELGLREWLPSLRAEGAVSIHRDYSPRNWLAGKDGELTAVIDFEHARWDVRAADLNRWWDHEFQRHPRLANAFFEAYGKLDDQLAVQVQTMRLFQATAGTVWGVKVNEIPFSERNRRALHRMMADPTVVRLTA